MEAKKLVYSVVYASCSMTEFGPTDPTPRSKLNRGKVKKNNNQQQKEYGKGIGNELVDC